MFSLLFHRGPHAPRSAQAHRLASRPGLEALEDRCVPSTLAVTSTDDNINEKGTLRYAVAHASSGDTILLKDAVQGITLTQGDLVLNTDLTIKTEDNHLVTLSGGGNSRVFELTSGADVILNHLELTQGNGTANNPADTSGLDGNGGAILNFGTLTINQGILFANSAADGGGAILNDGGTLRISNTILASNSSPGFPGGGGFGGAIWNFSGLLEVSNSLFSVNTANDGGGAILNSGTMTISNTILAGNSALGGSEGGAILNDGGTMTVSDSLLSGNSAGFGGAIFLNGGTVIVTGSLLLNNTASLDGGALYNFEGGTLLVGTSTFSGNTPDTIVGGFTDLGGNNGV
jgi:hypothetical protein